jgi:hypothetical protein
MCYDKEQPIKIQYCLLHSPNNVSDIQESMQMEKAVNKKRKKRNAPASGTK